MNHIYVKRSLLAIPIALISGVLISVLLSGSIKQSKAEKDWMFLADILHSNTNKGDSDAEKLVSMTDWLHENVKHVKKYPSTFDGSSVVSVINGGVGNCGFQSSNISVFADILGLPEHRIYHCSKDKGAPLQHAFAEINVDGKWRVYDPDMVQYVRSPDGEVLGVQGIVRNIEQIEHKAFKKLAPALAKQPPIYELTRSMLPLVKPYGEGAYDDFERFGGEKGFKSYLAYKQNKLAIVAISLLLGFFISLRVFRVKKPTKKPTRKTSKKKRKK